MNGSPLFTGGAGSGESEIRRHVLENDWLDCIVALPNQLFYNTGIGTYIWILTNRKPARRKGKVVLVNGAATVKDVKGNPEPDAEDPGNFQNRGRYEGAMERLDDELKRSDEMFVKHFASKYSMSRPPIWAAV